MDGIVLDSPRNYYMNIREFANKSLEAVVSVVRPMQLDTARKRYEEFWGLALIGEPKELTDDEKQANWNRAVRRARQSIRFLCKQMSADRLLTLTYRANVEDREEVKADFARFLRLVRKSFPKWQYVAVLERQDRGAYHIHCAVKGYQKISVLRAAWYRALGGSAEAKGSETPGQIDVTSPVKRWGGVKREWDTDRLAGYISKYLHKTFDETAVEKKRYWRANDVKLPVRHRVWLGAENIIGMICEAHGFLDTFYGLAADFGMWLSSDGGYFWIGGRIDDGVTSLERAA